MARAERPRYLPPKHSAKVATAPPRWFLREAVAAFDLSPYAIAAMYAIADNLDLQGASRTSFSLIAKRGNMSRNSATAAVEALLEAQVLFELDERGPGKMMRYAIPPTIPYHR